MRGEYAVTEGKIMTTNKELLSIREANTPLGIGAQADIFAGKT